MSDVLLEARNLTKEFPAGRKKKVHAVSDVSLQVFHGETLGLVGESGCGKSTLGRLLIRLLRPDSGELLVRGEAVTHLSEKDFRKYRKKLQLIFQDPYASLDPRLPVRDLIAEPLRTNHTCRTREELTQRVLALMEDVGVPGEYLYRYPHQFSGGQRQRIGIARALAADPELIVCDEPVSALDVPVQNSELYEDSQVAEIIGDNLIPMWSMSVTVPLIFVGIMMLVLFLFLSIMIRQSRQSIGILRALGFSKIGRAHV